MERCWPALYHHDSRLSGCADRKPGRFGVRPVRGAWSCFPHRPAFTYAPSRASGYHAFSRLSSPAWVSAACRITGCYSGQDLCDHARGVHFALDMNQTAKVNHIRTAIGRRRTHPMRTQTTTPSVHQRASVVPSPTTGRQTVCRPSKGRGAVTELCPARSRRSNVCSRPLPDTR